MMKTLAELKREANEGKLRALMVYRYGMNIPERLSGIRPIVKANSAGIVFLNADGRESECRIERASLCEYDGENLKIYSYGTRDLTDEENNVLSALKVEMAEYNKKYPWSASGGYWHKIDFLRKRGFEYLSGKGDFDGSKRYDYSNNKIVDKNIRGDLALWYKIV